MWTFVGRKKRKVWLWLAVERHTRRIVAWVLGSRGAATLRRLWAALPKHYRTGTWYFTDEWEAYGPSTQPQRQWPNQHRGSHQLFLTAEMRRTRA